MQWQSEPWALPFFRFFIQFVSIRILSSVSGFPANISKILIVSPRARASKYSISSGCADLDLLSDAYHVSKSSCQALVRKADKNQKYRWVVVRNMPLVPCHGSSLMRVCESSNLSHGFFTKISHCGVFVLENSWKKCNHSAKYSQNESGIWNLRITALRYPSLLNVSKSQVKCGNSKVHIRGITYHT